MSQAKLAKLVGLAQATVAELEKVGQGSPAVTKMGRVLHVDAHWLATGEGRKEPLSCPLSVEVQQAISRLTTEALARLENQLRVQLDLPPLPNGMGNDNRHKVAA